MNGVSEADEPLVWLPLLNSKERVNVDNFVDICDIEADGERRIWVRCRLHTSRCTGKQCFLVLRGSKETIQAVCLVNERITKPILKQIASIPRESVLDIEATALAAPRPVESCTKRDVELLVHRVLVVSQAIAQLPIQLDDCMRSDADNTDSRALHVNQENRLDNRVIDLRTPVNQAIFRIEACVTRFFREELARKGFIEIHTPKIISAASEGGANVFKVSYFNRDAYLAQSPQLYKQMAIAADFERVFTVGSVFRAEDSNSHRHLTEFIGLDAEMAFKYHYHEALETYGQLFIDIFKRLQGECAADIKQVHSQYSAEPFEFVEPPLIIPYRTGVEKLRSIGVDISMGDDLNTANERLLGKLIKTEFGTDFFILDKYPLSLRPFYTMPDHNDPELSNSYDMFMRGEEITSGAQRIHDSEALRERVVHLGINPEQIKDYIEAFRYGCSPHAGIGVGLERVVMLYLGLNNVRKTSLFPRDPKRVTP